MWAFLRWDGLGWRFVLRRTVKIADTPCGLCRRHFVYFLVHSSVLTFVIFDIALGG